MPKFTGRLFLPVLGVSKLFITGALMGAGGLEIPVRIINGWFADQKFISVYTHITLLMTVLGINALLCAIISSHAG